MDLAQHELEHDHIGIPQSHLVRFTAEGGLAIRMINKTGAASVKGTLVEADTTTDNACNINGASGDHCIGVVYDSGKADGDSIWVVVGGKVHVLLKDTTAATHGNWVYTADVAGRADATQSVPLGSPQHFQEIGHCIESKGSGTDVLAMCVLHFN